MADHRFSSASHSSSGKSRTQRKAQAERSTRSRREAISRRSVPSTELVCNHSPAATKRASPSSRPETSNSSFRPFSSRVFTRGPLSSPPFIWNEARPFEPSSLARSSSAESSFREKAAPPGTRSPRTTPPSDRTFLKGSKPAFPNTGSRLQILMGIRRSGLSLP